MKIDKDWLRRKDACAEGLRWFKEEYPKGIAHTTLCKRLVESCLYNWASWLVIKLMTKEQCACYSLYAGKRAMTILKEFKQDDPEVMQVQEAFACAVACMTERNAVTLVNVKRAAYALEGIENGNRVFSAIVSCMSSVCDSARMESITNKLLAECYAYAAGDGLYTATGLPSVDMKKLINYGLRLLKEKQ